MNLFHEAKKVLDKDGKVNPLGPYGKQKLTGREVSTYFRRNKVKDPQIKKAVEVALDLQGAMSVASSEIKKFYGDKILKSKEVQSALKYANESVEYDIREDLNEFRRYIVKGPRGEVKVTANSESDAITRARSGHMANTPRSAFSARMEGSFYGQDGMNKAAKKMFNKNTHVKLVKDKGSYQSATISKTDTKKIAQLKKNGYKQVPLEDLDKEDEKTVKDVIGQLKKAVKAHSGQVKTLTKDLKDSKEVNEALIALSPKQHDILKKAGMTDAFLKKHDAYVSNKNPRGITISSPNPKFFDLVTKMSKKPAVKKQLKALKEGKLGDSIIRKDFPNVWAASAKDREILKKFHAKVDTKNYVKQKALYKKDIKGFVDSLNEVTDKEINMAKKLSKDMEKVKKGYQQIAKTGDKTLKDTKFNPTYEAILKAQQKVLSLIGELNTMKIMSDRNASRKKDSKGRPIMSSMNEAVENALFTILESPYDKKDVANVKKLEKTLQKALKDVDRTMRGSGLSAPAFSSVRSGISKAIDMIQKFYRVAAKIPMKPTKPGQQPQASISDILKMDMTEGKVLKFTKVKDKSLEKHLKTVTKKVGAKLEKIPGGFAVSDTDMRGFTAVVDFIFDKSIKKNMLDGGGMSDVNMVNENVFDTYRYMSEDAAEIARKSAEMIRKTQAKQRILKLNVDIQKAKAALAKAREADSPQVDSLSDKYQQLRKRRDSLEDSLYD